MESNIAVRHHEPWNKGKLTVHLGIEVDDARDGGADRGLDISRYSLVLPGRHFSITMPSGMTASVEMWPWCLAKINRQKPANKRRSKKIPKLPSLELASA